MIKDYPIGFLFAREHFLKNKSLILMYCRILLCKAVFCIEYKFFEENKTQIPKIIHYCSLSNDPIVNYLKFSIAFSSRRIVSVLSARNFSSRPVTRNSTVVPSAREIRTA